MMKMLEVCDFRVTQEQHPVHRKMKEHPERVWLLKN